ncbi:hypothetical protein PsAD13_02773 [Pseudovibrio sp. Ad13]|uniref:flagellar basal body-associated FliL family protein n=1 Tax=unclassified Pseudovibrio TaxID=2627060 RepID=UPI000708EB0B|nr:MULTISPECIES: flagellar basal body-associated FliL family protein [unclassified Pseudovibrio]KZK83376.1 hypothetical protein PsAD13_02773 [Pseudovibrio sp. Ad13]KZK86550.1 hypothetical protein PsAD46_02937 [Pseudovibrio sp. Ad46]KZK94854.1 hypothetical protein PsW74_04366 [Pseudovibrio sp. W74]KZL08599.1 hypothetical protein PsAD14_02919 [Pseudovibrio sp. Ad14]
MLKVLVTGVWICLVTVGAAYFTALYKTDFDPMLQKNAHLEGLDYQSTPTINVPVLEDGKIHGYIVAQFVFTVDSELLAKLAVPPHAFIVDEAFRIIYSKADKEFAQLKKSDLKELTDEVRDRVNERFATDIVQDVLIQDFTFHVPASLRDNIVENAAKQAAAS